MEARDSVRRRFTHGGDAGTTLAGGPPAEPPRGADLLRRCAEMAASPAGDDALWQAFVRRYGRYLKQAVRRALREAGEPWDRDSVEDLRQEVYCRLLEQGGRRLRAYRGGDRAASIHAYLGRVARSAVLDEIRRRRAQKRGGGERRCALSLTAFEVAVEPPRPEPCAEQRAIARQRLHGLVRHYAAGADEHQLRRSLQVLRWSLLEGWTSREIAAVLPERPSPSSVDSMLYRLRRRLAAAAAWA